MLGWDATLATLAMYAMSFATLATCLGRLWGGGPPDPPLLSREGCHHPGSPQLAPPVPAGGASWG
eukprot:3508779-Alexandrium_andersonii.AAC.1